MSRGSDDERGVRVGVGGGGWGGGRFEDGSGVSWI